MRLIDADALRNMFAHGIDSFGEAIDAIDEAPTVEPKKGEWKVQKTNLPVGISIYETSIYHCSRCGVRGITWTNFCPECGADMRGEENDD